MTSEDWHNTDRAVRGSNQSGVRAHNQRLVLSLIRQNGPQSKAGIARTTGLSAQTISVIMRELETEGLLEKREPVRGKVGQPSVPMGLVATGAYFLGLKVGRRSLDLVLTDFLGTMLGRVHQTHRHPDPDVVVAFARRAAAELLADFDSAARARVAGLGIAIPFKLWEWARPLGVAQSEMDVWRTRDIRAEIEAFSDFPVYLQNDATAACGAELVFGDRNRPPDFLYFFVGFFIGGGLVLGNNLYTGPSGNAASLGPMPVRDRSGGVRALLDVASLATLERDLTTHGLDGEALWRNPDHWDIPGDLLDRWLDDAARGIAEASIAAATLIDFSLVVVDGWLPAAVRSRLVDRAGHHLSRAAPVGLDLPDIRQGSIGSDARSLGGASLPLSDRFLVDRAAHLKI